MQYDRILVRATNWLGDAVMSLPALHGLRRSFPGSRIAVLARPSVADLYRREPVCDQVLLYNAPPGAKGLLIKAALAHDLRKPQFDCAILLPNAFEAAAVARIAGIPTRIGYNRDGRGLLLTQAIPVPRPGEIPAHQRFYYLELLKRAGLIAGYSRQEEVVLSGSAEAAVRGREALLRGGVSTAPIGVSPGAAYGAAKRWLPERFAEAAVALARRWDAPVAVFGTKDEAALGADVAEAVRKSGVPVLNFAGRTSLGEFIDAAAACRAFLTNDSGSMHVASALGVPTVVVFGPTDEEATGPAGHRNAVIREPVECAPCHLRECPIDHRCMARVSSARVVEAAEALLR